MTVSGWILLVAGALVNFLAKPILAKTKSAEVNEKTLLIIKTIGLWLVIVGAVMIFIAGGKVNVGTIR